MIAIYDKRFPDRHKEALRKKLPDVLFHPFSVPKNNNVYESIIYHPDIYLFQLNQKIIIHSKGLPGETLDLLKKSGMELIEGKRIPNGIYPDTAYYNAVSIGNYFLHNLKYTDPVILDNAKKQGFEIINVSQGYVRCSVVILNDNTVITSDNGIAESLKKLNFNVLKISQGSVELPGEKYGFLGGASGLMPDGRVLFVGDIDYHPDVLKIKAFLYNHKVNYITLKNLPLYDCGTILFCQS